MTIFSLYTNILLYPPPPFTSVAHFGCKSRRSPPPPWGPFCNFFPMWEPYCYVFLLKGNLFYHVGAFLVHFSPYVELILPCGGLFGTFFSLWGTFFTMWGSFFSMWGPLATFSSLLGPFFYHVGRQSYHVGDFLLRFSFYWELVSPCGGIFATFLYIWGAFLYIYVGPFCTYGGGRPFFVHMGGILGSPPPPPRTNIPARPRVPIAIPHHIIMPAITRRAKLGQMQGGLQTAI